MTSRASIVCLLILAIGASASADPRAPATADEYLARGDALFAQREYAKALVELQAAYALDARPAILYNIAQAQRLGGDCRAAIRTYEQFIATRPDERFAAYARENIDRCREIVGRDAAALPTRSGAADFAAPPSASTPRHRAPLHRDPVALLFAGSGLVTAATGAVIWKLGRDDTRAANAATTYDEFERHAAGAHHQRIGGVVIVTGAVLVAAGLVKHVVAPPTAPVVTAGYTPDGSLHVAGAWTW